MKIPVRPTIISRNAPHNTWQAKAKLYNHLLFSFFSDFNSIHDPSQPDQRWEGELEDEFDGHVGPPPQIQYTRCPDYTIDLTKVVYRPTQPIQQIKPKIYPLLTWLVPEWKGKDDYKAHIRKESKGKLWTETQTLPTPKTDSAHTRWESVNPVMTWPDLEQKAKMDHEAHIWKNTEGGPNKQSWQ